MSVDTLPVAAVTVNEDARTLRSPIAVAALAAGAVALALTTLPLDRAVVAAFVAVVLIVLSAIDIERGIIPNGIVLRAAGVVVLANVTLFPGEALEWVLAPLAAALFLMIPQLFGRSWMGMGDVKLALLIGAALGWGVVGAVLLAFVCVLPVALLVLIRQGVASRKSTIPFGPFMAIGALIVLFGPPLAGL
jgi:leader peptidase (prepilin peptidase)/N-methyltransferase